MWIVIETRALTRPIHRLKRSFRGFFFFFFEKREDRLSENVTEPRVSDYYDDYYSAHPSPRVRPKFEIVRAIAVFNARVRITVRNKWNILIIIIIKQNKNTPFSKSIFSEFFFCRFSASPRCVMIDRTKAKSIAVLRGGEPFVNSFVPVASNPLGPVASGHTYNMCALHALLSAGVKNAHVLL